MYKIKSISLLLVLSLSILVVAKAELPDPEMEIDDRTALVITDPQNDFLSPKGVAWGWLERVLPKITR